jgi:hypothetical protein
MAGTCKAIALLLNATCVSWERIPSIVDFTRGGNNKILHSYFPYFYNFDFSTCGLDFSGGIFNQRRSSPVLVSSNGTFGQFH